MEIETTPRGAIIFATGMEDYTISRHFAPDESGTLLEYVLDSVWTVADELFVIFEKQPELSVVESLSPFGVKILTNEKNGGGGPLATLNQAFKLAKSEHCLLTTERVPLLKPNVVLSLFENAQGYDLAIPRWSSGRIEPLLAVYRKKAFVRASGVSNIKHSGMLSTDLASVVENMFAVKYVLAENELGYLDPEFDSFFEVKDEKSLQQARTRASVKGKKTTRKEK